MNQLHKDIIQAIKRSNEPATALEISQVVDCERTMVSQSINYINKFTQCEISKIMSSDRRLRYWIEVSV